MKMLILTGMSGAGKSTAIKLLEDMGYLCVDNLPIGLLKDFADIKPIHSDAKKVAVGIDIRNADSITDLKGTLAELDEEGREYQILFLDCSDDKLIRRYKETRRAHPLSRQGRVEDAIAEEREKVAFLRERADYILNTTNMLVRDLKVEMEKIFIGDADFKSLYVTILSFGYKYGIPTDADLVFDVRFLPNPYYVSDLQPLDGNDEPIKDFVMDSSDAGAFIEKVTDILSFLLPKYVSEGKTSLVVAFGCTGGKHRSVVLSNAVYERLNESFGGSYGMRKEHRDILKDRNTK